MKIKKTSLSQIWEGRSFENFISFKFRFGCCSSFSSGVRWMRGRWGRAVTSFPWRLRSRKYVFLYLLLSVGLVAVLISLAREPRPGQGFQYETFRQLCELAYPKGRSNIPIIESAAIQLSPENYQKWTTGELYVPDSVENGVGLHEDFNDDGHLDRLVPIKTNRGFRLVLALGQANGKWKLAGIVDGTNLSEAQIRDAELLRTEVEVAFNTSKLHQPSK